MSKDQIKLNQRKRASLQQTTLIIAMGIAVLLIVALLSYDKRDPGLFHSNSNYAGECYNKIGCTGAWIADFLYGLLGYFAFAVPLVLVLLGLTAFRTPPKHMRPPNQPVGGLNNILTSIGAIMTLLAGSGLAEMLFPPVGGGILGTMVADNLQQTVLGFYGTLLVLLPLFLGGVTLVGDIHWGELSEKIGDHVLKFWDKLHATRERHGPAVAQGSEAALSVSKDLLRTSRNSVGKMGALLGRVNSLTGQEGKALLPRRRKSNPLEEDVYGNRDPLLDNDDEQEPAQEPAQDGDDQAAPEQAEPANKRSANLSTRHETEAAETAAAAIQTEKQATEKKAPPAKRKAVRAPVSKDGMVTLPRVSLLNPPPPAKERVTQSKESLNTLSAQLIESLGHYGVKDAEVVARAPGPVITRFELQLPVGTKASKVSGLANDLARNMCVSSVRVVEVIPGRPTIGIEVPNEKRDVVTISEMIESAVYKKNPSPLTLALGKDISGNPIVADLARMPHLLVAGTTGSGKSVAVNAMLLSLLYKATPEEVRLILIDPKMLELSSYENIPHLIAPVVTDMKDAANALRWSVAEMERRYLLMSKLKVRNIDGYNQKVREAEERGEPILDPLFDATKSAEMSPEPLETLPYIVIVVDEFADMMMVVGKKVEELIARLAQKARAAGIHLILATQRPSVDVITGLIKSNIPTRIAFQVSTKIDSRTILDQGGAEQLLGYGDMLYMPPGISLSQRVHGALVTDQEVEDVANYLKQQREPDYVDGVLSDTAGGASDAIPGLEPLESGDEADPLYDEAVKVVTESRRASISYLQRRLKVGYNRAASMIEDMEIAGVVTPVLPNGTRDVLAPPPIEN